MTPLLIERVAFLEARRDDLQAAGNRLLARARDAEARLREGRKVVATMRADLTRVGEDVRQLVMTQAATIAELQAEIERANRLGYSPSTLRGIAASCSTQASRAGMTQDEVFRSAEEPAGTLTVIQGGKGA